MSKRNHYKVVILGSGPAGLTAALYAARAELAPLVVEGGGGDDPTDVPGGQLMLTTDVDNYPGFPQGILGPELMEKMRKQVERFGAEFRTGEVTGVELHERPFVLKLAEGVVKAEALVVGGGDTAMEEATFLTKFATKATVVHRRDSLRASKAMQTKARGNPKIAWMLDSVIEKIRGGAGKGVTGALVRNVRTGKAEEVAAGGIFMAIGHTPNTALFRGQLEMDENGYLLTREGTTATSVPGVFAAGDVADHRYRQAVTAAGTGCMAAIDAERFLSH